MTNVFNGYFSLKNVIIQCFLIYSRILMIENKLRDLLVVFIEFYWIWNDHWKNMKKIMRSKLKPMKIQTTIAKTVCITSITKFSSIQEQTKKYRFAIHSKIVQHRFMVLIRKWLQSYLQQAPQKEERKVL